MNYDADQQTRIDSYLMSLRRCLGELPPEEVNEILREIRGHILERAEAGGELTNEKLVSILRALGRPEDIAPLYHADAMVARARTSFSPVLILKTVMRWAMMSVAGFGTFLLGLIGYALALGFLTAAIMKPIFPDSVGLWAVNGVVLGVLSSPPEGPELLGWWIIPVGLVLGASLLVGTTHFLRWALRFAGRRVDFVGASAWR